MTDGFQIIPAIDLIDGKCVRLTEGDYGQKKVYREDPLEVAREFEEAGLKRLHLVDLDGARAGRVVNWAVLETIAKNTQLEIDFGGGVKTAADLEKVLHSGARWVTVGSIAVKEKSLMMHWLESYGAEKFFLGADVKQGAIAVSGWTETTTEDPAQFIHAYFSEGLTHIFCTDVSKDGRLEGPSVDLYRELMQKVPGLRIVASGGVSSIADIHGLRDLGCAGVILGKAIYEGRVSLRELAELQKH